MGEETSISILFWAFGIGFLSSFTPCVFPLIPVTLSLFGAQKETPPVRRFLLSLSYVIGIAVTYTILGMVSAKTGVIFGSLLGSVWVVSFLCFLLIALALFSLEIINFTWLNKMQTHASRVGGRGFIGAFLMGTASGLVAAPCVGPALVLVLGLAAASKSLAWGAAILFVYSLGLGTIFLLLGTFSGLINSLPRAGNWLNAVKFVTAAALFLVALFLAQPFLAGALPVQELSASLLLLVGLENFSIWLGWRGYKTGSGIFKVIGAFLLALASYHIVFGTPHAALSAKHTEWLTSYDEALKKGTAENKIVMLDLYADWCAACKEFEALTFPDPAVQNELTDFILVRVDFTDTGTPEAVRLTERYQVPGLPCIIFIAPGSSGEEIANTRITGFVRAKEFSDHLVKVKENFKK